jgi:ankyrin repeat protein
MKKRIFGLLVGILTSFNAYADFQTENTEELERQIAEGLDVNTRDENGDTLLYWFLVNGDSIKPLKILIDAGADVNAPSSVHGMTPLVYATTLASRLQMRAQARFPIAYGQTSNDRQIARANIRKSTQEGLEYALEVIKLLLDAGADINQETPFGTPLMSASTSDLNAEIVDYLLKAGADVNQQDRNGRTALFYAAAYDCQTITIQLLSADADINIKDNDGKIYMDVTAEELRK